MDNKIEIKHLGYLYEFYDSKISACNEKEREVQKERAEFVALKSDVEAKIAEWGYKNARQVPSVNLNGYKADFSWLNKGKYIMKRFGTPLTTVQIYEELSKLDESIKENRRTVVSNLSSVLGTENKKSNTDVVKGKNENGEITWSLNKEKELSSVA